MEVKTKQLVVVGGPDGAGKTTFAEKYSIVNNAAYLAADKIAAEMSPDQPEAARLEAASRFVTQFEAALANADNLVVESTLSGKTFRHLLRQRLLIVDVHAEKVLASRFSHWLIDPKRFNDGRLELEISSSLGINWMRPEPLVIDVRNTLDQFKLIPSAHNKTPTNNPMHGSGEVGRL